MYKTLLSLRCQQRMLETSQMICGLYHRSDYMDTVKNDLLLCIRDKGLRDHEARVLGMLLAQQGVVLRSSIIEQVIPGGNHLVSGQCDIDLPYRQLLL